MSWLDEAQALVEAPPAPAAGGGWLDEARALASRPGAVAPAWGGEFGGQILAARRARSSAALTQVRPGQLPEWQLFADALDVNPGDAPYDLRAQSANAARAMLHPLRQAYDLFTAPPEVPPFERDMPLASTTYGRGVISRLSDEQKVALYEVLKRAGKEALLTGPAGEAADPLLEKYRAEGWTEVPRDPGAPAGAPIQLERRRPVASAPAPKRSRWSLWPQEFPVERERSTMSLPADPAAFFRRLEATKAEAVTEQKEQVNYRRVLAIERMGLPPEDQWKKLGKIGVGESLAGREWVKDAPGLGVAVVVKEAMDAYEDYKLLEADRAEPFMSMGEREERLRRIEDAGVKAEYLQARGTSFPADVANLLLTMVPFAAEVALTSGATAGARAITGAAGKRLAAKLGAGGAARLAGTVAGKGLGYGASAAITTGTVGQGRVAASMLERMTPEGFVDESGQLVIDREGAGFGEALAKATTETAIAYGTEYMGGDIMAAAGKIAGGAIRRLPGGAATIAKSRALASKALKKVWKGGGAGREEIARVLRDVGYHGPLEEWSEERADTWLNALANTNRANDRESLKARLAEAMKPDMKQWARELVAFTVPALPGAAMGVARGVKEGRRAGAPAPEGPSLFTPEGIREFIAQNPEAAAEFSELRMPSRTAWEKLGVRERSGEEQRAWVAREMREQLEEVSDAQRTGAEAEVRGPEAGVQQRTGEPVHMGDAEKYRVEARPGELGPEARPGDIEPGREVAPEKEAPQEVPVPQPTIEYPDLAKLSWPELKAEAKRMGLKSKGSRVALTQAIHRARAAEAAQPLDKTGQVGYSVGEEATRGTRPEDLGRRAPGGQPGVRGVVGEPGGGRALLAGERGVHAGGPQAQEPSYQEQADAGERLLTPEIPAALTNSRGTPLMPEGEWQRALSDPVWGFQRVNKFLDPRHNTPEALAALGLTPEKFAGIGSIKKALHRRAMARWDAADEAAIRRGHEAAKKPPQAKPPESRAVVPERQAVQGTAGVSTALPEGTIDFTAVPEKVKAESEWRALLRARKEADTAREEFDRIAGERNQPDYAGEFSRQDEAEAEKEAGSADKAVEGAEADFLAAEIRVRLEDAGLEVGIDESGLSEARYLEVTDENGENAIRVRLAKHTARPTYQAKFGEADIEISWGAAHPDADIILKGVEDRASLERAVDRIKAKLKLPPTDEVGGVPVEPTKPPPPGPPTEPPPGYTKLPPAAGGLSYEMGPVSPKIPPKPETTGPAQHINLRKYNISDEAADIIVKAGTLSRERLDAARRGKIPLTATDAAAARLAEGDMRWFWNRKPGTPFNDAEITLARDMLASAASAEAEAKQAIRAGDESPAAMERYQRARALTDEIHEITEGASAEIGRALGAHRLMAEVIEKFSDVLDIAERWRRTGKAGKIIRVSDMIYEFWRNVNLLSGLGTDAANILGNTLGLGLRTSGTIVKSIYMKDRYLGEAAIELGALKTYRKQAWEAMKAAWREETPSGKVADLSPFARGGAIPGKFGKIVRAFGYRKLGVEDALFKALLHGSEIEKMAYRQARSEGLGGEALGKRTAEIMAESATKWRRFTRAARAEADYWTYQKSLGPGGAMIVRGLNLLPGVRYITPFKITPVNIAKVTLEHTMLNALRLIYQRSRGQISTEMFAEEMAKPIIGTMIQAGVLLLAANGLITGGGPKDKNRREALYRAGWQPYSARIGNQLFGYNRLEPAGSVMGFAADIFEAAKGEREELLGKLGMSLARNLTSKTFLQAVSGFLDAMQDPERNLKSFIKSEAGSIVPSIVAASARAADPTLRLAPGVGETIRSRIPGVSQGLPPRRDLWGKPIVRTNTPAERFASPVSRSEAKSDPVDEEMIRAGLEGVGLPAKTFSHENEKVELDARQYDQYVQQSGELAYRLVAKAIADPAYANLGEEDKQNLIKGIINAARKLTAVEGVPATEERRQEQVRIEIGKLAALPPMKGKDGTSLFALRQEQAREQRVAADLLAEAGVTPAEARKLYWAHLLKTVKTPQSREWAMQRLTAALRRTAPK